jgi:hypothetical protein
MPSSLLGDWIKPRPLIGESNANGSNPGINFIKGVEVMFLLKLETNFIAASWKCGRLGPAAMELGGGALSFSC